MRLPRLSQGHAGPILSVLVSEVQTMTTKRKSVRFTKAERYAINATLGNVLAGEVEWIESEPDEDERERLYAALQSAYDKTQEWD